VSPTKADTDSDDASTSGSSHGAGGLFHFTFDVRKQWRGLGALKACPPHFTARQGLPQAACSVRLPAPRPGASWVLQRWRPGQRNHCGGADRAGSAGFVHRCCACYVLGRAQESVSSSLADCSSRGRARRRCSRATCWARAASATAWPRPATSRAPTAARERCGGWRPHSGARRRRRGTGCRCPASRSTLRPRTCRVWRWSSWCAARAATCSRSSQSCAARRPLAYSLPHGCGCDLAEV
jgi:hypothetical protein